MVKTRNQCTPIKSTHSELNCSSVLWVTTLLLCVHALYPVRAVHKLHFRLFINWTVNGDEWKVTDTDTWHDAYAWLTRRHTLSRSKLFSWVKDSLSFRQVRICNGFIRSKKWRKINRHCDYDVLACQHLNVPDTHNYFCNSLTDRLFILSNSLSILRYKILKRFKGCRFVLSRTTLATQDGPLQLVPLHAMKAPGRSTHS